MFGLSLRAGQPGYWGGPEIKQTRYSRDNDDVTHQRICRHVLTMIAATATVLKGIENKQTHNSGNAVFTNHERVLSH